MREQNFRLVLASASPRRRELLTQAGYVFEVAAADVDESVRVGEGAGEYVRRLAEEKARVVLARCVDPTHVDETVMNGAPGNTGSEAAHRGETVMNGGPGLVVLGADTTVVCDGEILGKPADAADAMRMLRMLAGRKHEVLTGIAVASAAGVVCGVETTVVTFAPMPERELAAYCATAEPMDKAGAYGIQGYAARWIPRIEGCYFNVMGLPIARVVGMIQAVVDRK
ncbi:MAG TPA: Maf family protein [Acidobacteriaceae bacterium]|nr:Maf family protein [Acidobacteriaceae bacterium]